MQSGFTRRITAVSLATLLVVVTPGWIVEAEASPVRTSRAPQFSGEDLADGLLLGRGPLVQRFPQLSPASLSNAVVPRSDARMTRVLDTVLERMGQLDPEFFTRFEAQMTSGDHYRIRQGIDQAGLLLWRAIEDVSHTDRDAGAALAAVNRVARKPDESHADAVVVALVAVVIVLFIVLVAYREGEASDLAVDVWVDSIATTLKG